MNYVARLLLTGVAALIPFLGQSQESLSYKFSFEIFPRNTFSTLDALTASLLDDPYVLTEIGVSRSQLAMVPFRAKWNEISVLTLATQVAQADVSDEDRSAITAELTRRQTVVAGLKTTDLTASQRQKLQRIALRDYPLQALLTSEVNFALKLSNEQVKRLTTIRTDYWNRCSKIEQKAATGPQMLAKMKQFEKLELENMPMAQRLEAVSQFARKMEEWVAESTAKLETPIAEAEKEANKRAQHVLTSSQTKRYRELMK